jgi:hypothetical protein
MKFFQKKVYRIIILVLLIFPMPISVYANVIWPSVYISEGMLTWWIIIAGLLIEFIFIKIFTKDTYIKCLIIDIVINTISTLIGIVLIPISGIIGEIILLPFDNVFNTGTFHISHWIFAFVLTVFCNTIIEALALKIIFKKNFRKIFWLVFCANIFSVIICVIKIIK